MDNGYKTYYVYLLNNRIVPLTLTAYKIECKINLYLVISSHCNSKCTSHLELYYPSQNIIELEAVRYL